MNENNNEMRDLIAGLVGSVTGFAREDILSALRGVTPAARARQVAMYLAHVSCSLSLAQVGAMFGRDKSTVAHAVHQIEDLRDDLEFDDWMSDLEAALDKITNLSPRTHRVLRGVWHPAARDMPVKPDCRPA